MFGQKYTFFRNLCFRVEKKCCNLKLQIFEKQMFEISKVCNAIQS